MSTTHTLLTAKLQQWLEDDDTEFSASIDDIINLGELRLWRDLDLAIFTSTDSTTTAVSTDTLTKPTSDAELVTWQSLYYDNGDKRVRLELRSYEYVRDYQTPTSLGPPRYYAELSDTQWLLAPTPDAIYVVESRGLTRPTKLSSGNQTTWLSKHQDDLLFKACLAEAEGMLKGDDRRSMWQEDYVTALPLAKRETYEMLNARYNLTPLEVPAVPTTQR